MFNYNDPAPFGKETKYARESDNAAIGEWWNVKLERGLTGYDQRASKWFQSVDRDQALAFALYTQDHGVLKLTAQCFPLLPDEPKVVSLEFKEDGQWVLFQKQAVQYPGWSVHFRVDDWDAAKNVPYRLSLGDLSEFEGLVRADPMSKDTIVVGSLNCNSPVDKEFDTRKQTVDNLKYCLLYTSDAADE